MQSGSSTPDAVPADRRPPVLSSAAAKWLFLAVVVFCGLLAIAEVLARWRLPEIERYGDFFSLWASAKVAAGANPLLNYDAQGLHAQQVAWGMAPGDFNPFPYPPFFILMLAPLAKLGLSAAYLATMGVSLALYGWAMIGGRWRQSPYLAAVLVVPTTTATLFIGQTSLFAAALLIGGFRLAKTRSILAGVLFGLLAYKPQLGLLVPLALAAAGLWRVFAAASATVIVGVVAGALAYGWGVWPDWLGALPAYSAQFDQQSANYAKMPTLLGNLLQLGAPLTAAWAAQFCASAVVFALIWRQFRAGVTAKAVAVLCCGAFLATPHALVYDLPIFAAAIVIFIDERLKSGGGFDPRECAVILVALFLPTLMIGTGAPLGAAVILAALWLVLNGMPARQSAPLAAP